MREHRFGHELLMPEGKHCTITIVLFSLLAALLIGGGITLGVVSSNNSNVTFVNEECSTPQDCTTEDKCIRDSCLHGQCVHSSIENCCLSSDDCEQSECYTETCHKFTCIRNALPTGTACNDQNTCTVSDKCNGGICSGETILCDKPVDGCSDSICVPGEGCVLTHSQDGTSCGQNNTCSESFCMNGICATGPTKDCTVLDSQCSKGVCDINTGNCVALHTREAQPCDDGKQCTIENKCVAGICSGKENPCFDNNPCSINKCVEGFGCMLKYNSIGSCNATCLKDSGCPGLYTCADGTCILLDDHGSKIRFVDYNIESCVGGRKLVMDYILETEPYQIGDETRYIIPKNVHDFVQNGIHTLGFIDEVTNLESILVNNVVRTGFTLSTSCQPVSQNNCDTIFTLRNYKFFINVHHCLSVDDLDLCLDPKISVGASIDLSISDCTMFDKSQSIPMMGQVVIYDVYGQRIIPPAVIRDHGTSGNTFITLGLETPIYTNPSLRAVTTGLRICTPKVGHHLSDCVAGKLDECTVTGCYNWDPDDSPIARYYDIVDDGLSPIAKTEWSLAACYEDTFYVTNSSDKCLGNKCPNTVNGINIPWVAPMDDGFRFSTVPLEGSTQTEWTFDFKFYVEICGSRRLRASNSEFHNLTTLII